MSNAKQKSVWGIALKAGTIQATQTFGSRKEAEDAIATISHLSNGFEAVELGPVNSPELPDGWVMVPKVPTEEMVINGFESAPDQFFSDKEEWNAYQGMSGCQQAAHRAKLCWTAMLAAAPKPEK
jgi:hypothetical protein